MNECGVVFSMRWNIIILWKGCLIWIEPWEKKKHKGRYIWHIKRWWSETRTHLNNMNFDLIWFITTYLIVTSFTSTDKSNREKIVCMKKDVWDHIGEINYQAIHKWHVSSDGTCIYIKGIGWCERFQLVQQIDWSLDFECAKNLKEIPIYVFIPNTHHVLFFQYQKQYGEQELIVSWKKKTKHDGFFHTPIAFELVDGEKRNNCQRE